MPRSAYIHIPFCEHICYYCDFNKVFLKGQPVQQYLEALDNEIAFSLEKWPTANLETIFVGGGTPTALNLDQTEFLLKTIKKRLVNLGTDIEYTFEANPGGMSKEKLALLKEYGVNRLSFGVQVFDDELLSRIGRTHRRDEVFRTIDMAQQVGFTNLNVDLIYSLPGQTLESFKETLQDAFTLGVQHFSAYSLQVEPKTVFYNLMRKNKLALPSNEESAEMYECLLTEMSKNGFEQYEISNFSLKGYESQHNLTYWKNEEYYGFGAGAHSYVGPNRISNIGPVNQYIDKVEKTGLAEYENHEVTIQEKLEEEFFLGLRKRNGVSREKFFEKYNCPIPSQFEKEISTLKERGLLEEINGSIRLTREGLFLGNEVFQAFLA